jgi:hypothetical protein
MNVSMTIVKDRQSGSPESLCFAIMYAMALSPLIENLKKWRTTNELSQADAVKVFQAGGLPVSFEGAAKLGDRKAIASWPGRRCSSRVS